MSKIILIFAFFFLGIVTSFAQGAAPAADNEIDLDDESVKPAEPAKNKAEENKTQTTWDTNSSNSFLLDFSQFNWNSNTAGAKTATTVTIGTQTWMGTNLDVTTFRNGDAIPEAKTNAEWQKAYDEQKPAWCYYNNDPANGAKYGKLYNWYAITDQRKLAPAGWKIPTKDDWNTLNCGYKGSGGRKMKSATGWTEGGSSSKGTNDDNFSALPGGYRMATPDSFSDIGNKAIFWTSTITSVMGFDISNGFILEYDDSEFREHTPYDEGLSVRCIKE